MLDVRARSSTAVLAGGSDLLGSMVAAGTAHEQSHGNASTIAMAAHVV